MSRLQPTMTRFTVVIEKLDAEGNPTGEGIRVSGRTREITLDIESILPEPLPWEIASGIEHVTSNPPRRVRVDAELLDQYTISNSSLTIP